MTLFIGIAGGSGSGKTTVARNIRRAMNNPKQALIVEMDSYYRNFGHIPFEERQSINFDHPDSLDFSLLHNHITALLDGRRVEKPIYDFVNHRRQDTGAMLNPADTIILEGILTFHDPALRELMDIRIFVHTDDDIRVLRRIRRDMRERGREFEHIRKQYYTFVKPMYHRFVEPTKRLADIIVPQGGGNRVAVDMIVSQIDRWHREKNIRTEKGDTT